MKPSRKAIVEYGNDGTPVRVHTEVTFTVAEIGVHVVTIAAPTGTSTVTFSLRQVGDTFVWSETLNVLDDGPGAVATFARRIVDGGPVEYGEVDPERPGEIRWDAGRRPTR